MNLIPQPAPPRGKRRYTKVVAIPTTGAILASDVTANTAQNHPGAARHPSLEGNGNDAVRIITTARFSAFYLQLSMRLTAEFKMAQQHAVLLTKKDTIKLSKHF